ncbi:hypothetical protein FIV07_12215 [Mycobacterium sp. THAF192]|nr:hypothetical protein FIV07_12215 [Mycobacterium sp. THAF192]
MSSSRNLDVDDHSTAPFVVRRNPIAELIKSNALARDIAAACIPDYMMRIATADEARARIEKLQTSTATNPKPRPTEPDEVADWLEKEVQRRQRLKEDYDVRLQVLRELDFYERTEAHTLLDEHIDDLLAHLDAGLQRFIKPISTAVGLLPPAVTTAADAIDAGLAEVWKTIKSGLPVYRDIRHVQKSLYAGAGWPFDRNAAGDTGQVDDPEARLYFHSNLDVVAPHWRGQVHLDGFGNTQNRSIVPWPADPTERLIWCIRNDSGIWCPTTDQVKALLNSVPKRNPGVDRRSYQQGLNRLDRSERRTLNPSAVSTIGAQR